MRVFNGSRGVRDVRLLLRDPLFASLCGARAVDGAREGAGLAGLEAAPSCEGGATAQRFLHYVISFFGFVL